MTENISGDDDEWFELMNLYFQNIFHNAFHAYLIRHSHEAVIKIQKKTCSSHHFLKMQFFIKETQECRGLWFSLFINTLFFAFRKCQDENQMLFYSPFEVLIINNNDNEYGMKTSIYENAVDHAKYHYYWDIGKEEKERRLI